jgi:hypothetical protein
MRMSCVAQEALHKSKKGVNRVTPNVGQQDVLRILVTKESNVSRIEACRLRLSHQLFKGPTKLERNPNDGVVRACVNAEHDKTLRLHLQHVLQLTG